MTKGPKIPDDRPAPEGSKRCGHSACRRLKPLAEFSRNRRMPDGLMRYCKVCKRAADNRYRQSDRGKAKGTALRRAKGVPPRNGPGTYQTSKIYREAQARYRESERGRLRAALRRARSVARKAEPGPGGDARRRLVVLYQGCLAALDPCNDVSVQDGCQRCPQCFTPKPLHSGFWRDVRREGGYSALCRRCDPARDRERAGANRRASNRSKRQQVLHTLRAARKRLAKASKPHNRARIEKTILICERELKRA